MIILILTNSNTVEKLQCINKPYLAGTYRPPLQELGMKNSPKNNSHQPTTLFSAAPLYWKQLLVNVFNMD